MNAPSRRMPAAPVRKASWFAWPFLTALIAGLVYWQPFLVSASFVGLGVLVWVYSLINIRDRRRLAASRRGENICNFARSFDRGTDTWILRAVYEELCRFLSVDRQPIPVRRADRFEQDLDLDHEDLEELARDIAFRAGRSIEGGEKNPLYGKVKTVADMVGFFEHQPKTMTS